MFDAIRLLWQTSEYTRSTLIFMCAMFALLGLLIMVLAVQDLRQDALLALILVGALIGIVSAVSYMGYDAGLRVGREVTLREVSDAHRAPYRYQWKDTHMKVASDDHL